MATKLSVALDWTPNTNHTGFYVAQARGLYAAAGLEVALLSPDADAAPAEGATTLTPARKVERGLATFGPSESAISYHTTDPDKPKLRAVATLLQGSTSAISVLAVSTHAQSRHHNLMIPVACNTRDPDCDYMYRTPASTARRSSPARRCSSTHWTSMATPIRRPPYGLPSRLSAFPPSRPPALPLSRSSRSTPPPSLLTVPSTPACCPSLDPVQEQLCHPRSAF